jgi:hypothetical protein
MASGTQQVGLVMRLGSVALVKVMDEPKPRAEKSMTVEQTIESVNALLRSTGYADMIEKGTKETDAANREAKASKLTDAEIKRARVDLVEDAYLEAEAALKKANRPTGRCYAVFSRALRDFHSGLIPAHMAASAVLQTALAEIEAA